MISIIIFHLSKSEYPKLCLKQALKYNNQIYFITDHKDFYNINHQNLNLIDVNIFQESINHFKSIYHHCSTNIEYYEFICILRWIVARDLMKLKNIKRAFICDSDVLIYDNITDINHKYLASYEYMLCSSSTKNVTGGQSIWNYDKIDQFSKFIIKFYQTQVENINQIMKDYKDDGGICDMTLLYYFCHNQTEFVGLRLPNKPYFKNDLTNIFDDKLTFDLHIGVTGNHLYPDDYQINQETGNKDIKFIGNRPYCFNKRLGKYILFILLHFQGGNKKYMEEYYIKSN